MNEVRIYIEGGGDNANSRAALRNGFRRFLDPLYRIAREKKIRFHSPIVCGGRDSAFEDFLTALQVHSAATVILLVDAEGPISGSPKQHLSNRDGWDLSSVDEKQVHLMAQVMESWFLADPDCLLAYFGKGFASNQLPKTNDVEQVPKADVIPAITRAARSTNKRRYHKIRHGAGILGKLDSSAVRKRALHCDRLFSLLEEEIANH